MSGTRQVAHCLPLPVPPGGTAPKSDVFRSRRSEPLTCPGVPRVPLMVPSPGGPAGAPAGAASPPGSHSSRKPHGSVCCALAICSVAPLLFNTVPDCTLLSNTAPDRTLLFNSAPDGETRDCPIAGFLTLEEASSNPPHRSTLGTSPCAPHPAECATPLCAPGTSCRPEGRLPRGPSTCSANTPVASGGSAGTPAPGPPASTSATELNAHGRFRFRSPPSRVPACESPSEGPRVEFGVRWSSSA